MITNPEGTDEQMEVNISKLKALGIAERIGARKNGRWGCQAGENVFSVG